MPQKTINSNIEPKQLNRKLLEILPKRAQDILISRFGLGKNTKKQTLESIGKKYGITRERVRQIENYALKSIIKSEVYKKEIGAYEELKKVLKSLGGIAKESEILNHISNDKSVQNHIYFMLTVSDHFKKEKEDEEFHHRWHIDKELSEKIHNAVRKLYEELDDNQIVPESEMIKKFMEHVKDISEEFKDEEITKRWLKISKKIDKNPLGEWGRAHSNNIKARGVRDYAYLVMRQHGSPVHFREVAKLIEKVFKTRAHVATTHNELIKDHRFVLVGRGLYALKEWGYSTGVVKDVIKDILEKEGPLPKEKIIEKVLKERHVKENTIMVNLQNTKMFRKDKEGRYELASK